MPSILIFDPQLVVARLQSQVAALKQVAGAADYAAAAPDLRLPPAAWVIEAANRAGPNLAATVVVHQRVEVRFGVVIAAHNVRDMKGEQAAVDMKALRTSVMTALLGWTPATHHDPCEYAGGRLIGLDNMVLWWQDDYITRLYQES